MSSSVTEGWSNPVLGKVFSLLRGSVIPNEHPDEKFDYYSLPIFDQTGSSATVMGSEIESNKTLISEQAILVSKLNPRKPRVQLVKEAAGLRRCASTEFMAYAPKSSDVSLPFYKYYFLSEYFSGRLQLVATGSTNSHVRVTPSETLRWAIPQPPLPEQQKIAAILSSVDDVIEKTRAQIDKLKDLKTGMMQELLTKGIGHTAFKDSPVGRIPEGWQVVPIAKHVIEKRSGASLKPSDFSEGGIEVIPKKAVQFGGWLVTDKKTFCTREYANSVTKSWVDSSFLVTVLRDLVPSGPSIGLIVGIDREDHFVMAQGVYGFKLDQGLHAGFLTQLSNSDWYRREMRKILVGSTQVHIRSSEFFDVLIPRPPIEEQIEISSMLSSVDKRVKSLETRMNGLKSVKSGLMQDLLSGQKRVEVQV